MFLKLKLKVWEVFDEACCTQHSSQSIANNDYLLRLSIVLLPRCMESINQCIRL
jgi:hypothetical protein